jgi:hypothetical protein
MRSLNDADSLAFRVMKYLNNRGRHDEGYFETPYGTLHLWFGRHSWEFEYLRPPEILPKAVLEGLE